MCFDKIFPNVSEYFNLIFYIYIKKKKKKKKSLTKLPRSNEVYLQLPSSPIYLLKPLAARVISHIREVCTTTRCVICAKIS